MSKRGPKPKQPPSELGLRLQAICERFFQGSMRNMADALRFRHDGLCRLARQGKELPRSLSRALTAMGVSLDYVIEGIPPMLRSERYVVEGRADIPVVGHASAGFRRAYFDDVKEFGSLRLPSGLCAHRIDDDSMEPLIRSGQYILVDPDDRLNPAAGEGSGHLALVEMRGPDGGIQRAFKRLQVRGEWVILESINPAYASELCKLADIISVRRVWGAKY